MNKIEIYTDGSSSTKPKKIAGWSAVLLIPDKQPIIYYGHLEGGTNNQGELLGVIVGVILSRMANVPDGTKLFTDSQYSIGVLRKGNNYFTNEDIIELGLELLKDIKYAKLPIKWVKGHSGIYGNELADTYAGYGKMQQVMKPFDMKTKYFKSFQEVMDFVRGAVNKWA